MKIIYLIGTMLGCVVDSTTNEPLTGVMVTNSYADTVYTNFNGEFTLSTIDTLKVSFISYPDGTYVVH